MTENKNPWKFLSQETVFDNRWIRVEAHNVINPAGNPNRYAKVCFKNQAVGVIPLDDQNNTWLVGQHRYTLGTYSWEIPEGGSPEGEAPLETARRELKEETGLIADHFELLLKMHTSNSVTDEEGYIYIARGLTPGELELDETEDISTQKLPLQDAVAMVMNGEITDSMSMAGLLKLAKLEGI